MIGSFPVENYPAVQQVVRAQRVGMSVEEMVQMIGFLLPVAEAAFLFCADLGDNKERLCIGSREDLDNLKRTLNNWLFLGHVPPCGKCSPDVG